LPPSKSGWTAGTSSIYELEGFAKVGKREGFRKVVFFRVGELAEEQGHHPDLCLAWGKVEITTWTHKINGLTENDFILAAKIDQLHKS
jgi:4a-hydroxytetrahydrobiopterin dehydratase